MIETGAFYTLDDGVVWEIIERQASDKGRVRYRVKNSGNMERYAGPEEFPRDVVGENDKYQLRLAGELEKEPSTDCFNHDFSIGEEVEFMTDFDWKPGKLLMVPTRSNLKGQSTMAWKVEVQGYANAVYCWQVERIKKMEHPDAIEA